MQWEEAWHEAEVALSTGSTAAAAEAACRAALPRGAEALDDELLRWPRGAAPGLRLGQGLRARGDAARVGRAPPAALPQRQFLNDYGVYYLTK